MQFSDECKVIIETMDDAEARAYIKFLYSEISRHKMDIREAKHLIEYVKDKFGIGQ